MKCNNCDGTGIITITISVTVPECCGKLATEGFCCGYPVPAQEQDYEPGPCPMCEGNGKLK